MSFFRIGLSIAVVFLLVLHASYLSLEPQSQMPGLELVTIIAAPEKTSEAIIYPIQPVRAALATFTSHGQALTNVLAQHTGNRSKAPPFEFLSSSIINVTEELKETIWDFTDELNKASRTAQKISEKTLKLYRITRCAVLDAILIKQDAWYPEDMVVRQNKFNQEWKRIRCWDPTDQPMTWKENWPSGVCKRLFHMKAFEAPVSRGDPVTVFNFGAISFKTLRHVSPVFTLPTHTLALSTRLGRKSTLLAPSSRPGRIGGSGHSLPESVLRFVKYFHEHPCDTATPIAVFSQARGGPGLEINSLILGLHVAIQSNRTFVLNVSQNLEPKKKMMLAGIQPYSFFKDLFRPSSCQALIESALIQNKSIKFTDIVEINRSNSILNHPIPREFTRQNIRIETWFRILASYFFKPSLRLTKQVLAVAGVDPSKTELNIEHKWHSKPDPNSGVESNPKPEPSTVVRGNSHPIAVSIPAPLALATTTLARSLGLPPPGSYAALHIRIGDICKQSACEGGGGTRPRHCIEKITPYLDVLRERGVGEWDKGRATAVYVATDSERVIQDLESVENSDDYPEFKLFFVQMNRTKYESLKMIEYNKNIAGAQSVVEILVELAVMAGARLLAGSFSSNVPRLAMALGRQSEFVSFDTNWCFNVACTTFEKASQNTLEDFIRTQGVINGARQFLEWSWPKKMRVDTDILGNWLEEGGFGDVDRILEAFIHVSSWGEFEVKPMGWIGRTWGVGCSVSVAKGVEDPILGPLVKLLVQEYSAFREIKVGNNIEEVIDFFPFFNILAQHAIRSANSVVVLDAY